MSVKLRKVPPANETGRAEPPTTVSQPQTTLRPLEVSGLVLTKQALIQGLRVYISQLVDIQEFESGDKFLLTVAPVAAPESAG